MTGRVAFVLVLALPEVAAANPEVAPATSVAAAPAPSERASQSTPVPAARGHLLVGADAGGLWTMGRLGHELGTGLTFDVFGQMDLGTLSSLRGEVSLGASRAGRAVSGASGTLWRMPLVASVVGVVPMATLFDGGDTLPAPYVKVGVGAALTLLGEGARTDSTGPVVDPELVFGGGVQYAVGRLWDNDKVLARLEVAYNLQFETVMGHFLGVTLGVAYRLSFDRDGDGVADRVDLCPDEPEDQDGFEDQDGCPDLDNDKDGIADDADGCPDAAEDRDHFQDDDGCPDPDNDKDGIADAAELCPDLAEDGDGFMDGDGCPDLDNDEDGIPDARDKCANEAEDKDGFEDQDGCPDLDNDKDGILDGADKCPNQPEDLNGFEDADGCPDAKNDNDHDGIPDSFDKCPSAAEDRDGFEDEDGCPDPDNDADRVPDATDLCPSDAGPADNNGCPIADRDTDGVPDNIDDCPDIVGEPPRGCPAKVLVVKTAEKIEIKEQINFKINSAEIEGEGSFEILNQVASVLRSYPEIAIAIGGHTDDQGGEDYNQSLSQQRAESVLAHLVKRGVDAVRLQAIGYGETKPVASNKTSRGREMNRRVEFNIVEVAR
ncbi:MAG: OmpA family protein [Deltaproteobacteria bacterium]|nr:OmpA family protein [Deltaproteobacteria bacterium]